MKVLGRIIQVLWALSPQTSRTLHGTGEEPGPSRLPVPPVQQAELRGPLAASLCALADFLCKQLLLSIPHSEGDKVHDRKEEQEEQAPLRPTCRSELIPGDFPQPHPCSAPLLRLLFSHGCASGIPVLSVTKQVPGRHSGFPSCQKRTPLLMGGPASHCVNPPPAEKGSPQLPSSPGAAAGSGDQTHSLGEDWC